MARPQQNDRTIRMRELARELENAEWPDEERTNPVIVNVDVGNMREKQASQGVISEGAEAVSQVVGTAKTWIQVAAMGIVAVSVVTVAIVYLLTHATP